MPTGLTAAELNSPSGGYLNNRFVVPETTGQEQLNNDEAIRLKAQEVAKQAFNTKFEEFGGETLAGRLGKYTASGVIDVGDTVLSILPGIEREDIWGVASNIGLDGLADWQARNKSGVEMTSALLGGVAGGYMLERYAIGALSSRLMSSTWLQNQALYQYGRNVYATARANAMVAQMDAAAAGQALTAFNGARLNYIGLQAAKAMGRALPTEIGTTFLLQNNEAVISGDASQDLFWFGVGLAVPGAAGALAGRYEMRVMANSPEVRAARKEAVDSKGWREIRDAVGPGASPNLRFQEYRNSALVTNLAIEANQAVTSGREPLKIVKDTSQQALQSELMKWSTKGMPENPGARNLDWTKNGRDQAKVDHIMDSIKDDPTLFLEADNIATGDSARRILNAWRDRKLELSRSVDPIDHAILRRENQKQMFFLFDGRWVPARDEVIDMLDFKPNETVLSPATKSPGQFAYQLKLQSGRKLNLDTSINIKGFDQMQAVERLGVVKGLREMSARIRSVKPQQQPVIKPGVNSDWMQLDFALYHAKNGGTVDFSSIPGANGAATTENDVAMLSLKKKIAALKAEGLHRQSLSQVTRMKYNLPMATSLERIDEASSEALWTTLDAVESGTVTSIQEAGELYNSILYRAEMLDGTTARNRPFEGNMFTANYSKDGKWYEPVAATFTEATNDPILRGTRLIHEQQMAANKTHVYTSIVGTGADDVAADTARYIVESPEGQRLTRIQEMASDQVTGTGDGISAELGAMMQVSARGRDNMQIPSAVKAGQQFTDFANARTKAAMESIGPELNAIREYANRKSLVLLDDFVSNRPGFDVNGVWTRNADGYYTLGLKDTPQNSALLGRQVIANEPMINPKTGKPIVLDEVAMNLYKKLKPILNEQFAQTNRIRAALGLRPIEYQQDWVPPLSTNGKYVAFMLDSNGRVVERSAIVATTQTEFNAKIAEASANKPAGYHIHTQDEIEFHQDVYDLAQQGWVDANSTIRKTGPNRGKLVTGDIRPGTLNEMLTHIQQKNIQIAYATARTVLADQIQLAKAQRVLERNSMGMKKVTGRLAGVIGTPHTIYDDYLKAIAGPVIAESSPRAITRLLIAAEGLTQQLLSSGWTLTQTLPMQQATSYMADFLSRIGVPMNRLSSLNARTFNELTTQLANGRYMPYEDLTDYLKQQRNWKEPPEVTAIAAKLRKWDVTLRLRYLEIPNAAMNMLGTVNNMPTLINNSKVPIIGEIVNRSGRKTTVIDVIQIMKSGMTAHKNPRYIADLDYARAQGALEQGAIELERTFSAINNTSSFWRFWNGDKTIKNATPFSKDWFAYHGADGLLGWLNDTTEGIAKTYAHSVGLVLADYHGITGLKERFSFASSFADQAIANYSPLNRGEMYQTAFGGMMGLYQTYAMTYNMRMFRYLETGDYAALARQMATQSALFGIQTNIGWNQLSALESYVTDDEATIDDMIGARFGPMVGSIVAHGGVSDMPKLLGFHTGIALYGRGDTNIRTSVFLPENGLSWNPTNMAAPLGTVRDVATGMLKIGESLLSDDRFATSQIVSEILATYMPNRALRGALTVLANDGRDIDRYGNLQAETKGFFESMVRITGLRTTRQQGEMEVRMRNRATLDRQAGMMENLRNDTKAAIRSGKLEEYLPQIQARYLELGLNPALMRTWLRQTQEAAESTNSLRELERSMKSARMQAVAGRYGFAPD